MMPGEDCGSATHGTIRRHLSWGLLTPTSFNWKSEICFRILSEFYFVLVEENACFYLSRRRLLKVASKKFVLVGVQSPTKINAPRGCTAILLGKCQQSWPESRAKSHVRSTWKNERRWIVKINQCFFLIPIGLFAVFFDLRKGKIPNELIVIGLIFGCCFQIRQAKAVGLLLFLGGACIPEIGRASCRERV